MADAQALQNIPSTRKAVLLALPFLLLHLPVLAVIWVGWSWPAVLTAVFLYALRMFAITGFYHRYFSHRAFKTTRAAQFVFALIGESAAQRGPLWWAAHHRHHHRHSDGEEDVHSPRMHGFFYSHILWIFMPKSHPTRRDLVPDLERYPELLWLDRYDKIVPAALMLAVFLWGMLCQHVLFAESGVTVWQMLVWGFFISTIACSHATFCINSLAHKIGTQRFTTGDDSRNSLILALICFGEGWHNNHHHYAGSARQGFYWWEIDLTYYALWVMSKLRIIWDLRPVPHHVLENGRGNGTEAAPAD